MSEEYPWFKWKKFKVKPKIKDKGFEVEGSAEFDSLFYNLIWKHVEKLWRKKDENRDNG